MARVKTNECSFAFAIEDSTGAFGVLPASPQWKQIEPNEIETFGAEIATVARYPISKNRQRRKGTITDLDSMVEVTADLTLDCFVDFIEGFLFSQAAGAPMFVLSSVVASGDQFLLRDGETGAGALVGSLIKTRGLTNSGNNGLNVVTSVDPGVAATEDLTITASNAIADETVTIGTTVYTWKAAASLAYEVTIGADEDESRDNLIAAINGAAGEGTLYGTGTEAHPDVDATSGGAGVVTVTAKLVGTAGNSIALAETMTNGSWGGGATNLSTGAMAFIAATGATTVNETVTATQLATLEVAGYRAAQGDLDIDSNGNLVSTTLDFQTLGLEVGQFIWIGGETAGTTFQTAANGGFARVMGIAQNLLTLDKKSTTFVAEDNSATSNATIDLYFGRFIRNVDVDDADYVERRFQFEAAYSDLTSAGVDGYEYAVGNFCNEVEFELPLTDKAMCTYGFIGTDTEVPTSSRKTNAANAWLPQMTEAFNTTSDFARLRITEVDETGLTTDFKSMTLTLNNNVSPEKVLGNLGARYMNNGTFEVDIETQCLFTDGNVIDAIRNNTTVTMEFCVSNNDGAIMIDIPSMTLGDGSKEFPQNESVLINLEGLAFVDSVLNTSVSASIFPHLPA